MRIYTKKNNTIEKLRPNSILNKTSFIIFYNNKVSTSTFQSFAQIALIPRLGCFTLSGNIHQVIIDFKKNSREFELNTETELIKTCLENSQDYNMIRQLNYVTYAGPICNI